MALPAGPPNPPPSAFEATPQQPPKPLPFMAMGSLGLKQISGFVWEDYDPALRGGKAARVYAKMETYPTCAAFLWAIESVVRGVNWEIEPARDPNDPPNAPPSEQAQAEADWLRAVLFDEMDTPWPDVVTEALSCLAYGFSLHEVTYRKRDDGSIGVQDVEPRPQDTILRWLFGEAGRLTGVVQRSPVTGREVAIPMAKLLHFRVRQKKRNPEGVSLLRAAYKSWVRVVNLENIEAIGLERDLAGLPVARVPSELMTAAAAGDTAAQQKMDEFVRMVRDLRMNQQAGVVLPSDPWPTPDGSAFTSQLQYDLSLLSSQSGRTASVDPAIQRDKQDIAMSVLADFIMLGQGGRGGSYALSQDKTELFLQSLIAITTALGAEAQRGLVVPLWVMNGKDPALRPRLKPGPVQPMDVSKLAANIASLAGAGMRLFPDTALENKLRENMGLPPMSDEAMSGGGGGDMGAPPTDQPPPDYANPQPGNAGADFFGG